MKLFGLEIKKADDEEIQPNEVIVQRTEDAPNEVYGAVGASAVQYFDHYLTIPQDEIDLILKYREISNMVEVDKAIEEIVSDAITEEKGNPFYVKLDLDDVEDISDSIKEKIQEEFSNILKLLKFNRKGEQIFRNWYIDGRLYYHIIPGKNLNNGIKKLTFIDAIHIKKFRHIEQNPDKTIKSIQEYYIYSPHLPTVNEWDGRNYDGVFQFPVDSICYVPSGLVNGSRDRVLSYLHKAIKPSNNLGMLEDALVIYRIVRAPERRVFYIDVGNLPKTKAEVYLNNIMNRYRTRISYDKSSGEMADGRRQLSMTEDYWLPRRDGGRGTEIDTLQGGEGLGEVDDIVYFRKKLYDALNVPASRIDSESLFNVGRSAEISREELKFAKFIDKLRKNFSHGLFNDILRKQLILKKIIKTDEWSSIEEALTYVWAEDSYYSELKKLEILKERLEVLDSMGEYVNTYYSHDWVRKNILYQTDEEIDELEKQRKKEADDPDLQDEREEEVSQGTWGNSPKPKPKPAQKPPVQPKPKPDTGDKETDNKPKDSEGQNGNGNE